MSWDAYVDNLTAQGCASAGLFDISSGAAWHSAQCANGIAANADEMSKIIAGIKGGILDGGSCKMGGVKFSQLRVVPGESALVKNNDGEKPIAFILFSTRCIVVATMIGAGERNVVGIVEKMKDYLAGLGY